MSQIKAFLFSVLVLVSLSACSGEKTVHWKQEVLLQDGRVIVVERRSKEATAYLNKSIIEYEQRISFLNPDTQERVEWTIPKGTRPRMLNFLNGIPYLVFRAGSVADYMNWGCPNPPHIVFVYEQGRWVHYPFSHLPTQFNIPNLLDSARAFDGFLGDGIVTIDEMARYLKFGKRLGLDHIDGKKINPISEGCTKEILIKQGRQAEISQ